MCFVYFIVQKKRKGRAPIKIGLSSDPDQRLKKLQTANPVKLKIIKKFEFDCRSDAEKVERTIHYLAGKRNKKLEGEWFILFESIDKLINDSLKMCRIKQKDNYY